MISGDDLRAKFLQYLAHKLPEEERTLFEQQLLTDQELSDAVALQEQDLIDDYVAGILNPEEAEWVRSWIKPYEKRVQRARMARALLAGRSHKSRQKRTLAMVLAAAACILVAIGISLRVTSKSHSEPSSGPIANSTPAGNQAEQSTKNVQTPAVILLVAERVRGNQSITTYNVSPDMPVQLQIMLASGSTNSRYTLKIASRDKDQPTILQKQNLKPQVIEGHLYVTATFTAGSLRSATYDASVSGDGEVLVAAFTVKS